MTYESAIGPSMSRQRNERGQAAAFNDVRSDSCDKKPQKKTQHRRASKENGKEQRRDSSVLLAKNVLAHDICNELRTYSIVATASRAHTERANGGVEEHRSKTSLRVDEGLEGGGRGRG